MFSKRKIMHADINHCYAQIVEMLYPALKEVPMAVGGHEELRHGIILARNLKAKKHGIKTAETLREAYEKCPDLVIVPPKYDLFLYYTNLVKEIYAEYTNKIESFGLDEAWLDLSESEALFGSANNIARIIQKRVYKELGLTISIGLSFNKIFAKLGSDLIKPMGFVEITEANYQEIVWTLPVQELLFIGRKTQEKLNQRKIYTIGDLANLPLGYLKDFLGKNGELIWYFANGYDKSVVSEEKRSVIKSVGNSITTPADIKNYSDAKIVFLVLVESVAARLKEAGLKGDVISISLRDTNLKSFTRQQKILVATNLINEIMEVVISLLKKNYCFNLPLRSIGVAVSNLYIDSDQVQLNLFLDNEKRQKQKKLEVCLEEIRSKYGFQAVSHLSTHLNTILTDFNPKSDHIIHPVSWF